MKKAAISNTDKDLILNAKYDLCELITSRYDESTDMFNIPTAGIKRITISNPRAGGISITLQKGADLAKKLLSFKGKTLYIWEKFPVPAQSIFESSKKMSTRYRDIFIEFG